MNLLSLDIGTKRIGIAVSESGIIASELTTIPNDGGAINFLIDLIKQREISHVVVGLPLLRSGDESKEAIKVRQFVKELLIDHPIELTYEDEILTSKEAERILQEQGLPPEEVKRRCDQFSAVLIMEQYLSSNKK